MEILKNPTTIKMLAKQIITACDEYTSLNMTEKSFRELIIYYALNHGDKLFYSSELNPTILNRIGKKRAKLVKLMICDLQIRL